MNTRRHVFPISSGEVDWQQVVRLQTCFTETLKAEQPAIAEAVLALGAALIDALDHTQIRSEGERSRLARLYLRLALRGDYAFEPPVEADPDLGVYG